MVAIFKDADHEPASDAQNTRGSSMSSHGVSLMQMGQRIKAKAGRETHGASKQPVTLHNTHLRPYGHETLHQLDLYGHEKLKKRCACKSESETSTQMCFEQVRDSFQKKYSPHGRSLNLPREKLSLDFELETGVRMVLTPELLLIRGGFNVDHDPFPTVSKWFEVGIDGMGRKKKKEGYRQQILSTMELESVPMKVNEVQDSSFLTELQNFLMAMGHDHKEKFLVPGSNHLHFLKGHNHMAPCYGCHLQWTVGLPLAWVPALFSKAGSKPLQGVMQRLHNLPNCNKDVKNCPLEYKGFVSLAAWVLQAAQHCNTCVHPKRCMNPWLARTHFGDLANFVRSKLGESALDRFPDDVLEVADIQADSLVFPRGIMDYLHFSELAEIGGMVVPRSTDLRVSPPSRANKCLPDNDEGLHLLAKQMLQDKHQVDTRLRSRACGVYGVKNKTLTTFTARTWLQEILNGRDIMADSDSPLTNQSFSKLVWKSMGSWRMTPEGGDRVFLECRNPKYCLGKATLEDGPVARIRNVAQAMQAFEDEMAGTM